MVSMAIEAFLFLGSLALSLLAALLSLYLIIILVIMLAWMLSSIFVLLGMIFASKAVKDAKEESKILFNQFVRHSWKGWLESCAYSIITLLFVCAILFILASLTGSKLLV